jgi:predicted dehydrogenase
VTLRIGFLGSGLAAEIHSKTLRAVAPSIQRYYASRDAARSAALAARFGGAGHFGTYEAAVTSPDIDAIIIGLPPAMHREWTIRTLEAGKHVIVEKPPFLTVAELDEVAAAAARAGRQVMVAENYFYKPLTRLLKKTIAEGDLGSVLLIQLNAMKWQNGAGWRTDAALAGGGALFEGGIHWISLLSNIGLTPRSIRAVFPSSTAEPGMAGKGSEASQASQASQPGQPDQAGGSRLERSAVVTIEYAEGAVATLSYSWDLPALVNGMRVSRVYGTGGTLRFETNGVAAALTGRRPHVFFPGLIDLAGYRAMMTDFITAIERNHPPAYDLTLARRDLQLIEEAYASNPGPHCS